MAFPMNANVDEQLSQKEYGLKAAATPSGIAITTARISPDNINIKVGPIRCAINSEIGAFARRDVPISPLTDQGANHRNGLRSVCPVHIDESMHRTPLVIISVLMPQYLLHSQVQNLKG